MTGMWIHVTTNFLTSVTTETLDAESEHMSYSPIVQNVK
jgi:hypothetical protein